jgi:TRAP-type C4-dicarboxylate transport system substrate-binding protein
MRRLVSHRLKTFALSQLFWLVSLCAVFTSVQVSLSSALARDNTLAHMFPVGSSPDKAAHYFANQIRNNGLESVIVVGAAGLGDESQNVRDLSSNKIRFAITGDLLVSELAPSFAAVNLPFTHISMAHSRHPFISEPSGSLFKEILAQQGIRHLSTLCLGTRYLTSNRRIANVKDLRGLKLRLPQDRIWSLVWNELGAQIKNIPFPRLGEALSKGTVNAQENPPSLIRGSELYKVQRYLIDTRHYYQRQFLLASEAYFAALGKDDQQNLEAVARATAIEVCDNLKETERADVRWLTSNGGMKLVQFDDKGVNEAVEKVFERYLKKEAEATALRIIGLD